MSEDRCICCGEIVPEGRMVCPNCEKQKPIKNLSHGEMVQIAEGRKKQPPRYIDANKLIDLATHEGAYGYVDVHDIYNIPAADVVKVVRCKDCRYCDVVTNNEGNVFCHKCLGIRYGGVELDWYCEHGERKEKTDAEIH